MAWWIAALLTVGCNAVFGVDELRFEDPPSGGATTSTGAGGSSVSAGGDGGTGGDGGMGVGGAGGGGAEPGCGAPSAISEDFEGAIDGAKWEELSSNNVSFSAGELVAMTPFIPGNSAAVRSQHTVDMTDDFVEIEVTQAPENDNATAFLSLSAGSQDWVAFAQTGTGLSFQVNEAGTLTETTVPFDAMSDRWWRMTERGGDITFATSADGDVWVDQHAVPRPGFVDFAWISAGIIRINLGGDSGTAHFDNLNTKRSVAWCKVETAVDDFEDGVIAEAWRDYVQTAQCVVTEAAGAATFAISAASSCAYESATAYDLMESHLALTAPVPFTFSPNVTPYVRVEDASGAYVEVARNAGLLYLETGGNNTTIANVADDPTYVLWRIREASGEIFFETASAVGAAWSPVMSTATPGNMNTAQITFGVRGFNQPPMTSIAFGSIN